MTEHNTKTLVNHTIHRSTFINILEIALRFGEFRFAQRAAVNWLTDFPGDLLVELLNIKAFIAAKGNPDSAIIRLNRLIHKDPLFLPAYEVALDLTPLEKFSAADVFRNGYYAAGGEIDPELIAKWSITLRSARANLSKGEFDQAESQLLSVIASNPPTPLAAIAHIELLERQAAQSASNIPIVRQKIIEHYYERWETCLQIRLYYAMILLESSQPELGVEIIHNVVVDDPAGQVVTQLWDKNHPYRDLWPSSLTGMLTDPLPASIASWFGLNLLTGSPSKTSLTMTDRQAMSDTDTDSQHKISSNPAKSDKLASEAANQKKQPDQEVALLHKTAAREPEELISTAETIDRIANRIEQSEITNSEGRFPVYIILSSCDHLTRQYGQQGMRQVLDYIAELKQAVLRKKNWSALTLLVDDPKSMASLHLKPVKATDPWAIKRTLTDLDETLAKRGEMIGALLIVGGPEIIPFHLLPNPIDDQDFEIPSDNPYATRDENYLAPEWPVGRIPGDATNTVKPLLSSIKLAAEFHKSSTNSPGWAKKIWLRFWNLIRTRNSKKKNSFGYSAAIWRRASEIVYNQIGDRKKLLVTPPVSIEEIQQKQIHQSYAYFNLHGILDSPNWYGHKDPTDLEPGPDYPVALRPNDIRRNYNIPSVVFSEACYGAYINGKGTNESIPLKFLEHGARTFVGSTATAYGSVTTPLIAADLLGHQFWKYVNQGAPVGEALRRAKVELVRVMHERQGYLDGEDQKTLISFILYGDPLLFPLGVRRLPKDVYRPLQVPDVQTVCDKNNEISLNAVPDETIASVKRIVKHYLPGMDGATIRMNKFHAGCSSSDHNCPGSQLHIKSKPGVGTNRRVVVVSKQVQISNQAITQVARMTLDEHGRVIKLAVTR